MPLPRFLSALQSAAACGMIGENMRGDTKMKEKVLLLGANGLVGRAVAAALREDYQIIPAAGHGTPEGGYCLPVEAPGRLAEVLEREAVDVLREMGGQLGCLDMHAQEKAIDKKKKKWDYLIEKRRKEKSEKLKLYYVCGVMGGLLMVIIIV